MLDTQYHIPDRNMTNILEKLNSTNDLGVIFDNNLTFRDHMTQKKIRHTVLWALLKEILYTWMSLVSFYYRNQWCDHIWNKQILCGVHINKMISKNLKK